MLDPLALVVLLKAASLSWWSSLVLEDQRTIWMVGGVVFALFCGWFGNRVMRWSFGHRKFRGTWYGPEQFEALLVMIEEDLQRGHRVMRHDEMRLLRLHKFGDNKTIGAGGWGYK